MAHTVLETTADAKDTCVNSVLYFTALYYMQCACVLLLYTVSCTVRPCAHAHMRVCGRTDLLYRGLQACEAKYAPAP